MLNVLQVKSAKPKEKIYHLTDGDGLMLRVYPNGKKKWILSKSIQGQRICKVLGAYPELSIKDARAQAVIVDKEIRITGSEEDNTFKAIFTEWLKLKKERIKNWPDIESRINTYIMPVFGDLNIKRIPPLALIRSMESQLAKQGKYETIKRICGSLRELEVFAFNRGQIDALKWQNLNATFISPAKTRKNRPSIPWKELPEAMAVLQKAGLRARTTWEVLLCGFYTLLRPGEYTALEWSWIDFENKVITVPAETMKMKRPHRVPITTQLEVLLKNRPRINEYVFPSTQSEGHFVEESGSRFLRRHGFKDKLVPHGIRSIGRTWMHDHDIPYDVAEKCIAHVGGTETVLAYDRSDLLDKRRDAMQQWCNYVEECLSSKN